LAFNKKYNKDMTIIENILIFWALLFAFIIYYL
jgi:hypothetical protein